VANPFKYSYKTSALIVGEKEIIWQVLTDLDSYHLWNPFTPKVETSWAIGEKVILTVQMKKGKKSIMQTEILYLLNPPDELAWGMNWGLLLQAERIQRLTTHTNGNTQYFTEDIIKGLLSPVVHLMYGKSIQKGFNSVAESLKKYIENP